MEKLTGPLVQAFKNDDVQAVNRIIALPEYNPAKRLPGAQLYYYDGFKGLCDYKCPNPNNNEGSNSLLLAIYYKAVKCVESILKIPSINLNVRTESHQFSALHVAVLVGSPMLLEILLDAGVDLNAVDTNSACSVELARIKGHKSCLEVLQNYTKRKEEEKDALSKIAKDRRESQGCGAMLLEVSSPERFFDHFLEAGQGDGSICERSHLRIRIHRGLLSARNTHHQARLHKDMRDTGVGGTYLVSDTSHEALHTVVVYLCTGAIKVETGATLIGVMTLADFWDIPQLVRSCLQRLLTTLSVDNVLEILRAAYDDFRFYESLKPEFVSALWHARTLFRDNIETLTARKDEMDAFATTHGSVLAQMFVREDRPDLLIQVSELDAKALAARDKELLVADLTSLYENATDHFSDCKVSAASGTIIPTHAFVFPAEVPTKAPDGDFVVRMPADMAGTLVDKVLRFMYTGDPALLAGLDDAELCKTQLLAIQWGAEDMVLACGNATKTRLTCSNVTSFLSATAGKAPSPPAGPSEHVDTVPRPSAVPQASSEVVRALMRSLMVFLMQNIDKVKEECPEALRSLLDSDKDVVAAMLEGALGL